MPREQLIVKVLEYVEKMTQASEEQTGQRAASNSLRTKLLGENFYQKFLQPRANTKVFSALRRLTPAPNASVKCKTMRSLSITSMRDGGVISSGFPHERLRGNDVNGDLGSAYGYTSKIDR
jgi:hypothetical protein